MTPVHNCPSQECAASHVAQARRTEALMRGDTAALSVPFTTTPAGYVLCWEEAEDENGVRTACDRRKAHQGMHSWEAEAIRGQPPHDCLENRLIAAEARILALEYRVSSLAGNVYSDDRGRW